MTTGTVQLGRIALKGSLLTGAAQAVKMAVSFISVIVLARLLVPEDFGLVASVAPLVAFVSLFQDLGLQQAIIQRRDLADHHLNETFWLCGSMGVVGAAAVALLAPLASSFYGDVRIQGLMMLAALPLVVVSFAAVPLALLNRNLRFGSLALNDVLATIGGFLVCVAAASLGFGYWSLIMGAIASSGITLCAAWVAHPWVPKRPTLRVNRDLLTFGANLTGFNIVNFFARNLDNILIGRYLGLVPLGYYDRAYKLLLFPIQNIIQPLSRVMIPLLSRIQTDKPRFQAAYMRTNWMLAAVVMPGVATLTMTAEPIVRLLFGERWLPVAPIFSWLGVASFIQPISSTTGWIFICQGRTDTMFRWGLYSSATTILSFVVGLQWGVVGVAAAYAISAYVFRVPVLAYVVNQVGPITARDFSSIIGLFTLAAFLAFGLFRILPMKTIVSHDLTTIMVSLILNYGSALMLAALYPPSRKVLSQTLVGIKTVLRPAQKKTAE